MLALVKSPPGAWFWLRVVSSRRGIFCSSRLHCRSISHADARIGEPLRVWYTLRWCLSYLAGKLCGLLYVLAFLRILLELVQIIGRPISSSLSIMYLRMYVCMYVVKYVGYLCWILTDSADIRGTHLVHHNKVTSIWSHIRPIQSKIAVIEHKVNIIEKSCFFALQFLAMCSSTKTSSVKLIDFELTQLLYMAYTSRICIFIYVNTRKRWKYAEKPWIVLI